MKSKTILLIEDDDLLRPLMAANMRRAGFTVLMAEDGEKGVSTASKGGVDFIFCDIIMPKKDGYSVLKELTRKKIVPPIPFVFLTGRVEDEVMGKARELGADGYLKKPVKKVEMLTIIDRILGKK